jgi:hypothetical protein
LAVHILKSGLFHSNCGEQNMIDQVKPLHEAGFALLWLHTLSKRPIGETWQSRVVPDLETLIKSYKKGNNVGVRLGKWSKLTKGFYLHIVDVDIRNSEMADDALAKLSEMIPSFDYENAPTVISGSGGESRHFYLITTKPFPSRKFAHSDTFEMVFDASKARDVKKWDWELHLLGTGSQAVIPPSIHPDTNLPYTWSCEFDAFDLDLGTMVTVPCDDVERLIGFESSGELNPERLKKSGYEIEQIRQFLSELPVDEWFDDRDGWFRTGMAVHHETGATSEGFDLWCEFSRQSEKFDLKDAKRVWKSFKGGNGLPFRMVSIAAVVSDLRMENDIEDYGDDLGEDSEFDDFGEEEVAAPGMFDDILGPDEDAPGFKSKKVKPSHAKLNKQNVEEALGKPTPPWVEAFNQKFAVARVQGKTIIMDFLADNSVAYGSATDLHTLYENIRRPKDNTTVPASKIWLQHPRRRTYPNGIVFAPNQEIKGAYNHWQGFSVEASPTASCELIIAHLKEVICSNNEEHYDYLIKWMAHMVQKPEEKPGVAVIARGKKGTGKDTPIEYMGKLIEQNYMTIANRDQMLGKFNSHLERLVLLHMQEGFWAGDKAAEGQFKYLITSPSLTIEPKGLNPFKVTSVLRIYVSSNELWVVPATEDERRYFVLNVNETRRGDHEYFDKLREEMEGDGPAALRHFLEQIDLSDFSIRNVPNTDALGEQKLQGLKGFDKWWFEILDLGELENTPEKGDGDLDGRWRHKDIFVLTKDLRENFTEWLRVRRYEGEPISEKQFTMRLLKMIPSLRKKRISNTGPRLQHFTIPVLDQARDLFLKNLGSQYDWGDSQLISDETIYDEDDLG